MIVLSSAFPNEFLFNQDWLDLPGGTSDEILKNQAQQMRKCFKSYVSYGGAQPAFLPVLKQLWSWELQHQEIKWKGYGEGEDEESSSLNALQTPFPLLALQLEESEHRELKWLAQNWPRGHVRARNGARLSHVPSPSCRLLATLPPQAKDSGPPFPVHSWDCTLPRRCPLPPTKEILHHRVTWM